MKAHAAVVLDLYARVRELIPGVMPGEEAGKGLNEAVQHRLARLITVRLFEQFEISASDPF